MADISFYTIDNKITGYVGNIVSGNLVHLSNINIRGYSLPPGGSANRTWQRIQEYTRPASGTQSSFQDYDVGFGVVGNVGVVQIAGSALSLNGNLATTYAGVVTPIRSFLVGISGNTSNISPGILSTNTSTNFDISGVNGNSILGNITIPPSAIIINGPPITTQIGNVYTQSNSIGLFGVSVEMILAETNRNIHDLSALPTIYDTRIKSTSTRLGGVILNNKNSFILE